MLTSAPTLAYFDPDMATTVRAAMGLVQFFCKSTQMDSILLPSFLELSQRGKESMSKEIKKMPSLHLGVQDIWSLPHWTQHIFCSDRPQATFSSDKHPKHHGA